jgi:hypothetical protein
MSDRVPRDRREAGRVLAGLLDYYRGLIHVDETRAVEPIARAAGWERGELPETYPFAV